MDERGSTSVAELGTNRRPREQTVVTGNRRSPQGTGDRGTEQPGFLPFASRRPVGIRPACAWQAPSACIVLPRPLPVFPDHRGHDDLVEVRVRLEAAWRSRTSSSGKRSMPGSVPSSNHGRSRATAGPVARIRTSGPTAARRPASRRQTMPTMARVRLLRMRHANDSPAADLSANEPRRGRLQAREGTPVRSGTRPIRTLSA